MRNNIISLTFIIILLNIKYYLYFLGYTLNIKGQFQYIYQLAKLNISKKNCEVQNLQHHLIYTSIMCMAKLIISAL